MFGLDKMFDFNQDGQLDAGERAAEFMFLDDMMEDENDEDDDREDDY